jgi:hypothetical protein
VDICLNIVYAQMFCLYWSRFVTTRQDPLFKSDLTLLTPTAATPLQIQHDPAMPKSLRSPLWRNAAWCRMNLGYRLFLVYLLVTFPSGTPFWPTCFMCCIAEGLLVMSPFFLCSSHLSSCRPQGVSYFGASSGSSRTVNGKFADCFMVLKTIKVYPLVN